MNKVDSIARTDAQYKQRDGNLRKNQKGMPEIKNIVTEMKNAFEGFISRLDKAEERISKLENISIETSNSEKQRKQTLKERKKKKQYPRTGEKLQKTQHTQNRNIRKKRKSNEQKKYWKQ